ncbi:Rrf2 family transcriptional regulator [Sporosarcina ureilytica]|uniref:Transcriptional regulator n=1 Tax=Sporosarcina ureilytica TaxID=298596 RepID=A0A1D8JDU9_9BACL|nr:Rrf2 family transcriptional regulator [Sporosarcina ureilytica]AOV06863.1 transcriptional regulator [Sporosarcina ureilytica]
MKYSKATNYALHTMVHLLRLPIGNRIGVQKLAEIQRLSPTYLSKILTKLAKSGLIESTPGVNGGYQVAKPKHEISFLDVILAIEGDANFFTCSFSHHAGCHIEQVMLNVEQNMKHELDKKLLIDIANQVDNQCKNRHKNTL